MECHADRIICFKNCKYALETINVTFHKQTDLSKNSRRKIVHFGKDKVASFQGRSSCSTE